MNVAADPWTPTARPTKAAPEYAWRKRAPRTADAPRRTIAFAADAALVFLFAWMAATAAASVGILRIPDIEFFGRKSEAGGLLWIVSILELPISLAYFTILEAWTGRTPGKILMGLRVVGKDGGRISFYDSFLRNLLRFLWVTPFGPAFIIIDLWSLNTTELDQRLGDLAVGSLVLDERE